MNHPVDSVDIIFLFLTPYNGQIPQSSSKLTRPKHAPYFFDIDVSITPLKQFTTSYQSTKIHINTYVYGDKVLVSQAKYSLSFPPSKSTIRHKTLVNTHIKKQIRERFHLPTNSLEEQYLILIINHLFNPRDFVTQHSYALARLVRSMEERLSEDEAHEILASKISYSQNDLTIVDWEGAIIFADKGDFQSDLELLKIANYQLLRYRMIDQNIESRLHTLQNSIHNPPNIWQSSKSTLKSTLKTQLQLLLEFEAIDQELLLIGDWYTAKLYQITLEEFYLDDWKHIVKNKLDQFSQIQEIYQNNLSLSWNRIMDLIQLFGWAFLLIGYFVLFYFDISKY